MTDVVEALAKNMMRLSKKSRSFGVSWDSSKESTRVLWRRKARKFISEAESVGLEVRMVDKVVSVVEPLAGDD